MKHNPLLKLESLGQSIWIDFISRSSLSSGQLQRLIEEDGVSGVTSNPSIFEKAIDTTHDYDDEIRSLLLKGRNVEEICEIVAVGDIQRAADLFRPVYDKQNGRDGFVSIEVSPYLAHDTERTIIQARRLWSSVGKPNVMIKVPATLEGLPAVQQLISEGINVNITLLFGLPRYRKVAEAFIAGLEARVSQGKPIDRVASVASFFLSRIDVLIDPMLGNEMKADDPDVEKAAALRGRVAISSAKVAYQDFKAIFRRTRFQKLASRGASVQRLLWASTSTKNPAYRDTKYVEPLIGPDTINTLPLETLNAYRDHGDPALRLTRYVKESRKAFEDLRNLGFDIDALTQRLEDEGVQKFSAAFDMMVRTITQKRVAVLQQAAPAAAAGIGRDA